MKLGFFEKGMVLLVVMLFLSIISLLALNLLDASLLETKMSSYYQDRIQAFYKAENLLEQYERGILNGEKVVSAEMIDDSICGAVFYRVAANATYHEIESKLQSFFVKIGDTTRCDQKPNITEGRQAFLVVE